MSPDLSTAQSLPDLAGDSKSENAPEPNFIEIDGTEVSETYNRWLNEITAIEGEISVLDGESSAKSGAVDGLVVRIRTLTDEVDQAADDAQSLLARPKSALAAIGSPPKADEPPEASIVVEVRERHQRALAEIQAKLTFVRLIKTRAEAATGMLASYGEDRWLNWIGARDDLSTLFDDPKFGEHANDLFRGLKSERLQFGPWFPYLVALLGICTLAASFWVTRNVPRFSESGRWEALSDQRKLALVRVAAALGYGVLPAAACTAVATLAIYLAPSQGRWLGIVAGLLLGLAVYIWLFRIFQIALVPTNEQARFLRGSDTAAHKIAKLLQGLCVLNAVFIAGYLVLGMSLEISAGTLLNLKLATVFGFSGYALYAARLAVFGENAPDRLRRLHTTLRISVALIGVIAVVAAMVGYVNFAVFTSVHIAGSILIVVATYFIRPMLHDGIRALFSSDAKTFNEPQRGLFEALAHLALDLAVLIMFLILMLMLWGVPFDAVWLWIKQTTNALTIGDFRIGLPDLAAAAVSFVVALIILRFAVRVLKRQVLEPINVDIGVRDSIVTILGYASFLLATLAAIATLGVDITSLALVFGALLLGVGFGLQNVVDNLVSGLIILFQRPIKSGDWISVGEHEGLVRATGLVSTEIATFEEASVVIPNSKIVSSAVLNRTLGHKQGRVDVPVGVAYGSDVGTVLEVLRDCAASNEYVLNDPEPTVVLKDFSDSSLHFELRAFIPDIRNIFEIASELRIAILKRFGEEGVKIPFPQRDVWLKNADPQAQTMRAPVGQGGNAKTDPPES